MIKSAIFQPAWRKLCECFYYDQIYIFNRTISAIRKTSTKNILKYFFKHMPYMFILK